MSVIIQGMKLPKGCDSCELVQDYDEDSVCCPFLRNESWYGATPDYRLEHCPLIEIPTPHGRLIDADALQAEADSQPCFWKGAIDELMVREATTIIEAEE